MLRWLEILGLISGLAAALTAFFGFRRLTRRDRASISPPDREDEIHEVKLDGRVVNLGKLAAPERKALLRRLEKLT